MALELHIDKVFLTFFLGALLFLGLAIAGGIYAYSPIPLGDMWDGYLGFFVKVSEGDWSAWWAQHNEHRIVLARILFWMDLAWFGGEGWFLIVMNYSFICVSCVLYWKMWQAINCRNLHWFGYFLTAWLLFWIQENNLVWGFQSQFILAQLLPLAAFYFIHRAADAGRDKSRDFFYAVLLGVLSIGSMANGILTLPLMVVFATVARMGLQRVLTLAGLSLAGLLLYFYEYKAPDGHGSLRQALTNNPVGLLHYVLLYIGGPFYYMAGEGRGGQFAATSAGILMIGSSIAFAWRIVPFASKTTLPLALLFFILYVGGTSIGTAGGRLLFGVEQALSSRYMTPALMAWAALFLLYLSKLDSAKDFIRNNVWVVCTVMLVFMLPRQLTALENKKMVLYERKIAALAIELEVRDPTQIGSIFPFTDWVLAVAKIPVERNLSIFGLPPFVDLRERLGQPSLRRDYPKEECLGYVDEIKVVPEDPRFLSVRGWIFDPSVRPESVLLSMVNNNGNVVGYAVAGQLRTDVELAVGKKARNSGFKGYLLARQQDAPMFISGVQMQCRLNSVVPFLLFKVLEFSDPAKVVSVSRTSIVATNDWKGKDFDQSDIKGMTVIGSFVSADADVGSVTLRMRWGDKLLYRSGPIASRQFVEVLGSGMPPVVLPNAKEWTLLEFSSDILPDRFLLRFSDHGDAWGEWSALAVNN